MVNTRRTLINKLHGTNGFKKNELEMSACTVITLINKLHGTNSFKKNELQMSACTVMMAVHTDACM